MQEVADQSTVRTERTRLFLQALIVFCAVVAAELALATVDLLRPGLTALWWYLILGSGVALCATLGLCLWMWWGMERRLWRTLEVVQGWLRGTLALRIGDRGSDRLGVLADQLDILVEHLQQDEQDLAKLREQSTRQIDQIRALAVDEERERLARELHDGVKQHLFSLSMTASALCARMETGTEAESGLLEMAREVEKTSGTVQRTLTRLAADLRPTPLQEQGLAAALNDYTLLFGAREHILVYMDVQGNDQLLPPSVAEALYRVAQEALHNVARHARATRVEVSLRCLPEQAILAVDDNGIGFDVEQVRRGLGLSSMHDRLLMAGGRLWIESDVGHGTCIRAEVRLTRPRALRSGVKPSNELPQPTRENWAWLGQRLVIPVGQTWPWPLAEEIHLRRPLVEPEQSPIAVHRVARLLGVGAEIDVRDSNGLMLARMHRRRWGYEWQSRDAEWMLTYIEGPRGTLRAVLARNQQPLAALQHRGRLLEMWSELLYDGMGYHFSCGPDPASGCVLTDGENGRVLSVKGIERPEITLHRAVPLPLMLVVAIRSVEDWAIALGTGDRVNARAMPTG
jgi:signal transduction histidine kinase